MGHIFAFGDTAEKALRTILGTVERGRQEDGPLVHSTGVGWVEHRQGHYDDALAKGRLVIPFLMEPSGAVHPRGVRFIRRLGRDARRPNGIDTTVYGRYGKGLLRRESGFETHHMRMISLAAVVGQATIISTGAQRLRRRAALA